MRHLEVGQDAAPAGSVMQPDTRDAPGARPPVLRLAARSSLTEKERKCPSRKARPWRTKNRRGEAPRGAPAYVIGRRSLPPKGSALTARRATGCGVPHPAPVGASLPSLIEGDNE